MKLGYKFPIGASQKWVIYTLLRFTWHLSILCPRNSISTYFKIRTSIQTGHFPPSILPPFLRQSINTIAATLYVWKCWQRAYLCPCMWLGLYVLLRLMIYKFTWLLVDRCSDSVWRNPKEIRRALVICHTRCQFCSPRTWTWCSTERQNIGRPNCQMTKLKNATSEHSCQSHLSLVPLLNRGHLNIDFF